MGRLIPAGTGMEYYRNVEVANPFKDVASEAMDSEETALEVAATELLS